MTDPTNTNPYTSINAPPSPAPTMLSFKQGDDVDSSSTAPAPLALNKKPSKGNIARKPSSKGADYYGEVFGVRQAPVIPRTAGMCVELKTNVILENEFEFAQKLSAMLSKRYNHDEASVCVSVQHSACMITGGTFDGTYMLTITSVSLISPTVNKRNAALITEWLAANLGVPPHRGYIRFAETDFANYAVGGYTVLDLMQKEELARIGTAEKTAVVREMSVKRSESRLYTRRERKGVPVLVSPEEEETTTTISPPSQPPISRGALLKKKSRNMFNLFAKNRQAAPIPA